MGNDECWSLLTLLQATSLFSCNEKHLWWPSPLKALFCRLCHSSHLLLLLRSYTAISHFCPSSCSPWTLSSFLLLFLCAAGDQCTDQNGQVHISVFRIAVACQREAGIDPNSSSCSKSLTKSWCSTAACSDARGYSNWSWQHNLNPASLCICIAIVQTVITWSHIFAQMNLIVYKFTII